MALSGMAAMVLTHQLRAAHDAILVGVGTVLADDPQLTVRLVSGQNPQPVILDSALRTPPGARLMKTRPPAWIFAAAQAAPERRSKLEQEGARVELSDPNPDGRVDLQRSLSRLSELGIKRVMVEGGAKIITAFLASQLVDALVITIAPVVVGGLRAVEHMVPVKPEAGFGDGPLTIDRFPRLHGFRHGKMEDDLILWGKPRWKNK